MIRALHVVTPGRLLHMHKKLCRQSGVRTCFIRYRLIEAVQRSVRHWLRNFILTTELRDAFLFHSLPAPFQLTVECDLCHTPIILKMWLSYLYLKPNQTPIPKYMQSISMWTYFVK